MIIYRPFSLLRLPNRRRAASPTDARPVPNRSIVIGSGTGSGGGVGVIGGVGVDVGVIEGVVDGVVDGVVLGVDVGVPVIGTDGVGVGVLS